MSRFAIAVAGCGPGGLAAATMLARAGHHVTVFDRFAAPRPIGSGLMLQPTGMAVLESLGLRGAIAARGAPIATLLGRNESGRAVLDARYADLPGPRTVGLGIHRASLFGLLHDAARAAAISIRTGHEVAASHVTRAGRWLSFASQPDDGPFDLVVDALGLRTPLAAPCGRELPFGALWTTLPWPADGPFHRDRLEQRYRAAREMIGVLPIGARAGGPDELALFWSLPVAAYPRWRDRGLDRWRSDVAALWPECAPLAESIDQPEVLTLARYAHRTLRAPAGERLVHIGDAWHTASPQLGQGANMALLDAAAVTAALALTGDPRDVPAMAVHLRAAHVTLYQWITALFTPLYQSQQGWPANLRDRVLAPASRYWPGRTIQARLLSGLVGRPLHRLGLERHDYSALPESG